MVDGLIGGDRITKNMPKIVERMGEEALADVHGIASAFWGIHAQPKGAWSHETEVRPYTESW